ncbi:MAG: carbamoyl-phosphate synthase large subunit [Lachnospiraceae bacterium]|nr:carbamoyl-phosphate synthase large subunit [Lachnospiraceae bacterium]
MPKRDDIHKILVIGSGPIVIGQAAEFDYAGTQACLALREEGYEVVLANSNPATIMTDNMVADKVYMEPLTLEYMARICRYERPDAILPGIGGQTGLNLAMQLYDKGVLEECEIELLGTKAESIRMAEDREQFKELCERLGEPVVPSMITYSVAEGLKAAQEIGYPVILRPAYTLGGTGGGFANDPEQMEEMMKNALALSPVHQVLVEKSIRGYKEIEYEVMRDDNDTAIVVCNMENLDPVGIHTGDSIVVAPSQTLTNKEYQMLRSSALRIIRALKVCGGCNVQFALDPYSFNYYVIEVNPRVSRSSALASKASGYPIARVSAKIATGMHLEEIALTNTPACFEPSLDYVVTKMPRFPFDKFGKASNVLTTQMKATGETMSVGRTFEESLLKAIRSLEDGKAHIHLEKFDVKSLSDKTGDEARAEATQKLLTYVEEGTDDRIYAISQLLWLGTDPEIVHRITGIDMFFLDKIAKIVALEKEIEGKELTKELMQAAKRLGFSDAYLAELTGKSEDEVRQIRYGFGLHPIYKMIDTCASEFESYVPYFYSTYETGFGETANMEGENESIPTDKKKIMVLGSGPIRIGQGVEFDYSTVHALKTIQEMGYEAIVVNNNPETVSTDYTQADKLYFEPLTVEDILNIVLLEKPDGVIVSLGGQTAVNLAEPLQNAGVPIIGTDQQAIFRAEDRDAFEAIQDELSIPHPKGVAVTTIEDGVAAAEKIGYPVLVRPSFVLGGRAMEIVANEKLLRHYLSAAAKVDESRPVLVDKYVAGKEVEVDAICDGTDVFVPGIMELVERTGVHSGDSTSVYPPYSISVRAASVIADYTRQLGLAIGIRGLFNIQFIVDENEDVYIIEVNPRASRSVPFLSKSSGYPLVDIATRVMLGVSLKEQGYVGLATANKDTWYVKAPAFSFEKLTGMDAYLSPEMKSTGEAIGYDRSLKRAFYKALQASGIKMKEYGTVMVTLADEDKQEALPLVKRFYELGFNIEATVGTANFLKEHGIRTRMRGKLSDGSDEVLRSIRAGYVSYIINTRAILSGVHYGDGEQIRRCAIQNGVTIFTSLDTVRILLAVLEDISPRIATIF